MKRYENILNLLSKKYYGIKNVFFKNNIREGLENDSCGRTCDLHRFSGVFLRLGWFCEAVRALAAPSFLKLMILF